jgi:prepilin-type processing-associated H-X9-DG protein
VGRIRAHRQTDAVPIVVLQPFGPVRFVFEIGDTEGREVPGERMSSLFADGHVPEEQYNRTKLAAAKYGVEVAETDNYGTLLAGDRSPSNYFRKP